MGMVKNKLQNKIRAIDEIFIATDPSTVDDKTILDVQISKLHTFENHPFKVKDDDEKMLETIDSIKEQGVIYPIIIRPKNGQDGEFEIIAGHRRKRACELIGLETIPAIVKRLNDEESTIIMVDSNIQREELLFSEKAFAYKMKLDAMKQQGKRTDLTSTQLAQKSAQKWSIEVVADDIGTSKDQIRRYIRLTYLIKDLLDMVDEKDLAFTTSVELSYLSDVEQQLVFNKIYEIRKPSLAEAKALKEESTATNGGLTDEFIANLLLPSFPKHSEETENNLDGELENMEDYQEETNNIVEFETSEIDVIEETKETEIQGFINPVDFINSKLPVISSEPTKPYVSEKPLRSILKKRKVFYRYFNEDVKEEEIEETFIKLLEMFYNGQSN